MSPGVRFKARMYNTKTTHRTPAIQYSDFGFRIFFETVHERRVDLWVPALYGRFEVLPYVLIAPMELPYQANHLEEHIISLVVDIVSKTIGYAVPGLGQSASGLAHRRPDVSRPDAHLQTLTALINALVHLYKLTAAMVQTQPLIGNRLV